MTSKTSLVVDLENDHHNNNVDVFFIHFYIINLKGLRLTVFAENCVYAKEATNLAQLASQKLQILKAFLSNLE